MPLETAQYINSLNSANPVNTDPISDGDNHIRLIKAAVKATFPNITGVVTPTQAQMNYLVGVTSSIQTQLDAKLTKASNLSDLVSATTALTNLGLSANAKSFVTAADNAAMRTSLGLGTAATVNTDTLATAAQGTKADTALQSADVSSNADFTVDTAKAPTRGAVKTWVEAIPPTPDRGLDLIGTIPTPSGGITSLTGLDLTDYKMLFIHFNGINTTNTTNVNLGANGVASSPIFSTTSATGRSIYAVLFLSNGHFWSYETAGAANITNATTIITLKPSSGNFDGGTTYIYGLK